MISLFRNSRKITMAAFSLAALLTAAGTSAFAEQNTNKLYLNFAGECYTLDAFTSQDLYRNFYGVYARPLDLTQGIRLYLFPDSKFLYTEWGESGQEKIVAIGTYTFKNDQVSLVFNKIHKDFEKELSKTSFRVLAGQVEKEDTATGFISVLADEGALKTLGENDKCAECLLRRTELYDWKGLHTHFVRNKQ